MPKNRPHRRFGERKEELPFGLRIHPIVFPVSAILIFLFVILAAISADAVGTVFNAIQGFITEKAGWIYILCVNVFLGFVIYLLLSPYGSIRLGGPEARPDFTYWGWFSMLFSAGMGIGLLFYSVAEPVLHFSNPPMGEGGTPEAAKLSMAVTFYHWGLHTWAIYALIALALAFFGFRYGLPLTVRSAFYPLFGDRVRGSIGNVIDIVAVVATLFGVATSLGLGVQQINTGLNFLVDLPNTQTVQILLIAVITGAATTSVVLGLDKGIKRLSQFTMTLGLILLVLIFLLGPTVFLLESLVQNIGYYLQRLPELSTWNEAYKDSNWQADWTVFYWGWWISWSPFVGMFIARISRGRTVREFLLGVLFVPTILTFVWITVFGGTALHHILGGSDAISSAVSKDITTALFVLLEQFPLASLTATLAIIVVVVFFITSSDSGSFVIDIITAGGDPDPPVHQRIFWAVLEGVVAAVLLLIGGLKALQTASITTGLPFAIILCVMCVGLLKGLREEWHISKTIHPQHHRERAGGRPVASRGRHESREAKGGGKPDFEGKPRRRRRRRGGRRHRGGSPPSEARSQP